MGRHPRAPKVEHAQRKSRRHEFGKSGRSFIGSVFANWWREAGENRDLADLRNHDRQTRHVDRRQEPELQRTQAKEDGPSILHEGAARRGLRRTEER